MTNSGSSLSRIGPGAAVGVTEAMIHEVVHTFYGHIRSDPALGPIFNRVIATRWDTHLAKMCDFWSSVLLMTGRFKGTPMAVHAAMDELRPTHFARWLHLFHQTVAAVCPPEAAALFVEKSEMIAQSLQLGIAAARGDLPPVPEAKSVGARRVSGDAKAGGRLPRSTQAYRRTDTFTDTTVPPGLLRDHTTKSGTWGLIHVLEGRLAYRITDPRRPPSEVVLTAQTPPGVVEPTILHQVEPLGPVRFFVEFHKEEASDDRFPHQT